MNWKTRTALQLWRLNFSILVLPSGLLLHFHLEFDDTRRTSPSPGLILNKTFDLISLCLLYPFLTVLQTVLYYAQVNISFFFTIAQACCAVLQSWVSRKFMTGWYAFLKNWTKLVVKLMDYLLYMHDILFSYVCSVVLFPVAVTFFITWWFIQFVDGFFSPLYAKLGIDIFGNCCTHTSNLLFIVTVNLQKDCIWISYISLRIFCWHVIHIVGSLIYPCGYSVDMYETDHP